MKVLQQCSFPHIKQLNYHHNAFFNLQVTVFVKKTDLFSRPPVHDKLMIGTRFGCSLGD